MRERTIGIVVGFVLSAWSAGCARSVDPADDGTAGHPSDGARDGDDADERGTSSVAGAGGHGHLPGTAGSDGHPGPTGGGLPPRTADSIAQIDGIFGSAYQACGVSLSRGGFRLDPCTGPCTYTLSLSGSIDLHIGYCAGVRAGLVVTHDDGQRWLYNAQLSRLGIERAADISRGLDMREPYRVVGCDNAPDEPGAWIGTLSLRVCYPLGSVPEPYRAADDFVQTLIDQLQACEGALIEHCGRGWRPQADLGDAPCEFTYYGETGNRAGCALPTDVDAPCRQAATCLCASDALAPGSRDLDACVEHWMQPRGELTFADVCSEHGQPADHTLAEAMFLLGQAHGSVHYNRSCTAMPATR